MSHATHGELTAKPHHLERRSARMTPAAAKSLERWNPRHGWEGCTTDPVAVLNWGPRFLGPTAVRFGRTHLMICSVRPSAEPGATENATRPITRPSCVSMSTRHRPFAGVDLTE